ncbi:hypothetical protein Tco_0816998 [Tanacetum coccineum]
MKSRNASFFDNLFPCLTKENGRSSRIDVKLTKIRYNEKILKAKIRDKITPEEEDVVTRISKRAKFENWIGLEFVLSYIMESSRRRNEIGTIEKKKAIFGMILVVAALRNLEIRRVAEEMEAREAARTLKPLNENVENKKRERGNEI